MVYFFRSYYTTFTHSILFSVISRAHFTIFNQFPEQIFSFILPSLRSTIRIISFSRLLLLLLLPATHSNSISLPDGEIAEQQPYNAYSFKRIIIKTNETKTNLFFQTKPRHSTKSNIVFQPNKMCTNGILLQCNKGTTNAILRTSLHITEKCLLFVCISHMFSIIQLFDTILEKHEWLNLFQIKQKCTLIN